MTKKTKTKKENDDSLRFLTVLLDNKQRPKGHFKISASYDEASNATSPPGATERQRKTKDTKSSAFALLQDKLIDQLAAHRSLDNAMIMLQHVRIDLEFAFSIAPILEKHGTLIHNDKSKRIYSFDRHYARDVIAGLRKANSGLRGVSQLPRLVLIGLVSDYDSFLRDLIIAGLTCQKNAAASINRSLSLQELMTFQDISEATNYLIEREIDAILHDDHHEQLIAVGRLFNIKIDADDSCVKDFLEICERRNLFTHNAGIVNARYLNKCAQFKIKAEQKVGDSISMTHQYFQKSIITTQELSIKLN